jgi:hypothetical protein
LELAAVGCGSEAATPLRQDLTPFGWEDTGPDMAGVTFGSVAIGARLPALRADAVLPEPHGQL